jgi:hypothetical protein
VSRQPGTAIVRTLADIEELMAQVEAAAKRAHEWIVAQTGTPLDLLARTNETASWYA